MNDTSQFIRTLNAVRTKMSEKIFTRRFGRRILVRIYPNFGKIVVDVEEFECPLFMNFGQFNGNFIP